MVDQEFGDSGLSDSPPDPDLVVAALRTQIDNPVGQNAPDEESVLKEPGQNISEGLQLGVIQERAGQIIRAVGAVARDLFWKVAMMGMEPQADSSGLEAGSESGRRPKPAVPIEFTPVSPEPLEPVVRQASANTMSARAAAFRGRIEAIRAKRASGADQTPDIAEPEHVDAAEWLRKRAEATNQSNSDAVFAAEGMLPEEISSMLTRGDQFNVLDRAVIDAGKRAMRAALKSKTMVDVGFTDDQELEFIKKAQESHAQHIEQLVREGVGNGMTREEALDKALHSYPFFDLLRSRRSVVAFNNAEQQAYQRCISGEVPIQLDPVVLRDLRDFDIACADSVSYLLSQLRDEQSRAQAQARLDKLIPEIDSRRRQLISDLIV